MITNFQALNINWKEKIKIALVWISSFIFFNLNSAYASEPKPWQMDLQEPAGIIATKAADLHNFLLVVITLISVFVLGKIFLYLHLLALKKFF